MSLSIPVTLMTALLPLWMSSLATVADAGAATTRPPSVAPRACQPGALDKAQALYDAGRFDQAYAGFAVLADCGNADAARWALQMRQGGAARYGQDAGRVNDWVMVRTPLFCNVDNHPPCRVRMPW